MSINGKDISLLYKNPFDLKQEIKICNVTLNGMGNPYAQHKYFTEWDFNPSYTNFECTMACCVVDMLYQIALESNLANQQV